MPVALITGASAGLGLATTRALAARNWTLIVDARRGTRLREATAGLPGLTAVPGDIADPAHRQALATAVKAAGWLDLLVNNASRLGPSPQPPLAEYPLDELERVYQVDVFAPLMLTQLLLADLITARGTLINISSDAAVEAYPGWGGYGSAKAALDHLTAVFAAEQPGLSVYALDPGDMRTEMHQQAFPAEDISDRPEPETVAPALLHLIERRPASGRYRACDLLATA
jgi:NAD(P)-dependent dehydrogenase (short-subunit alcohol dehydrogenase family)